MTILRSTGLRVCERICKALISTSFEVEHTAHALETYPVISTRRSWTSAGTGAHRQCGSSVARECGSRIAPLPFALVSKCGSAPLSNSIARCVRACSSARRRSSNLWQRKPTKRRESGVRISAAAAQMGAWTSTWTGVERASMVIVGVMYIGIDLALQLDSVVVDGNL